MSAKNVTFGEFGKLSSHRILLYCLKHSKYYKNEFSYKKMGVTKLVFDLCYFKDKITAKLKRHCRHSNDSYATRAS